MERAAQEAAEKEAALARRRQEKAMSLGVEPQKGPDVTQVMIVCHQEIIHSNLLTNLQL